ncbi:unnamed protein product, partial [Effrenium voratum]
MDAIHPPGVRRAARRRHGHALAAFARRRSFRAPGRTSTEASMAAKPLLEQLREALGSEKLSKAAALEALREEMQAQLKAAAGQHHAELQNERLAAAEQRQSEEHRMQGWQAEAASYAAEAQRWEELEVSEKVAKDKAEVALAEAMKRCGRQQVDLYHMRQELSAAAESSKALSRLEASLEEGERRQKEVTELRASLEALTERCKRQDQSLARLRSAPGYPPRPEPGLRSRGGALRGLASSARAARKAEPLQPVAEDDLPDFALSATLSEGSADPFAAARDLQSSGWLSQASSMPDGFAAARDLQSPGWLSQASSMPDGFAAARDLQSPGWLSQASSMPDGFAAARDLQSPGWLSQASSMPDGFAAARDLQSPGWLSQASSMPDGFAAARDLQSPGWLSQASSMPDGFAAARDLQSPGWLSQASSMPDGFAAARDLWPGASPASSTSVDGFASFPRDREGNASPGQTMGQRFTKEFCSGRGAAGREVAPPALDLGKSTSETSPTQPGDSPALLQAAPAPEPKQEAAEPAVPEPEPKLEAAPAPEPKQEAAEPAVPEPEPKPEAAPAPEPKQEAAEPAVPEPEPKPEAALAPEPKQEAAEPAVPEPEPKPEAALAPEPKQEATEPAVQEPEPKREGELLEAADAMNSMPEGKGKGKGKGKPPPPAPKAKPKGAPKAAPKVMPTAGCGMSELLKRVEAIGEKKDREESKEIEDIDLSQIDPSAARVRVKCPRCEKEVLEEYLQSHMTAHSSEILPWLFLGGKRNLDNDVELTVRTGITHVLNLANDVTPINDVVTDVTAYNKERGLPFVYKKMSLGDTADQDILSVLEEALSFIQEAHEANVEHHVLVNCAQGVSRSASVVIAYLMKHQRMSLRDAYFHVRERRSIADPRKEFVDQLGRLEQQIFGLEQPTFTSQEAFEGRTLLNLDDRRAARTCGRGRSGNLQQACQRHGLVRRELREPAEVAEVHDGLVPGGWQGGQREAALHSHLRDRGLCHGRRRFLSPIEGAVVAFGAPSTSRPRAFKEN